MKQSIFSLNSFLLILILAGWIVTNAQSGKIIELQKLANKLSGIQKVDALNKLAFEYFSFDDKKANACAQEALMLSNKLNYNQGKGEAKIYIGLYHRLIGKVDQARQDFREGIDISRKSNNKIVEGYGLMQYGSLLLAVGMKDSSANYYKQSYQILKDSLNPQFLSTLYKNWGKFYLRQSDLVNGEKYLLRSLRIREEMNSPSLLVDIYLELAELFISINHDNDAAQYIKRAELLMPILEGEPESVYDLKYAKALVLMKQSNYEEALTLFNELKEHYSVFYSSQDYVNLLERLGYVLTDLGNYELGLNYYYEALTIADKNSYQYERTKLWWEIGWVYYNLNQSQISEDFTKKCTQSALRNGFQVEEATSYNLLGVIYLQRKIYDSALNYFQLSLSLREKLDDATRVASTLNNIGDLLQQQGKYNEAMSYYKKGLKIEVSAQNKLGEAWALQSLGQLQVRLNNFSNALINLNSAERISKEINSKLVQAAVLRSKVDLYKALKRPDEALLYFEKYTFLQDSLTTKTLANRITSLQSQYEITGKNKEILLLSKDKALQESQISMQRAIILVGIAGFIILLLISLMLYRHSNTVSNLNRDIKEQNEEIQTQSEELVESNLVLSKLNEEIEEQRQEIQSQAEKLLESNESISLINQNLEKIIENRTAELKQAYQELDTFFYRSSHDFRRPLTTFMGLAEVAKITLKDDNALELFQKVKETAVNLDKMLVKLQSISNVGANQLIYKEVLLKQTFENECDAHRELLRQKNINVTTEVELTKSFLSYPALIKIIIENLIENSIYFCARERAFIKLRAYAKGNFTIMEIEDNGQGIDPAIRHRVFEMYFRGTERSVGNGLGLYIVKKAVDKLKGIISFNSTIGLGTVFTVSIPNELKNEGI